MTTSDMKAVFRCFGGCDGEYPVSDVIYRCPSCDGLLEVRHDLAPLGQRSGAEWKELFDHRWRSPSLPDGSGVWGKREWVMPQVRPENIVTMGEGCTPLLPVANVAAAYGAGEVLIKHCGLSHTGSFKDLGMTVLVSMVKQIIADGGKIPAVACASTGDTSAALAAYAAAAGVPALVILPKGKISTAQLVQPLACGAHVLAVETDFDGCMAMVQKLSANDGVYLANSMNSLRLEGQKTVALEIVQQLNWQVPDWIVIPGGNLGNVSALGAGLEMMLELGLIDKRPRICVAQAERANPLYRSFKSGFETFEPVRAGTTLASAIQIGNPVSRQKAVRVLKAFEGVVTQALETELADAAALADLAGNFICPHTGVALAAVNKLAKAGLVTPRDRVVVVSTANGLKFSDFKTGYHDGSLPAAPASAHANEPVSLPNDYGKVRAAALETLAS
jgi:threonine synthase